MKTPVKAKDLVEDWDDDGDDENKDEKTEGVEAEAEPEPEPTKPRRKSETKSKVTEEFTPRKSSRAPKPTEKLLESKEQKNMKDPEEDEEDESVDAIAKELEKQDSDVKKSGKKASPKKGKKPVSEEKSKEDWVNLIFGENGEKITDKGKKPGEKEKDDGEKDIPESEEFLPDDTEFTVKSAKKGGRPKKKDLDEKLDGVAKLGSNMYFYTGPGGNDSPPLDSDDEDLPIKKADAEPARKSSRANKGTNRKLEREDEVVDMPQVKAPPKPNLNPSWLKNHDGKSSSTPGKKAVTSTPATKSTPVKSSPAKKAKTVVKPTEVVEEPKKEEELEDTKEEPMDEDPIKEALEEITAATKAEETKDEESTAEEEPEVTPPRDEDLPEFDPESFTPGTAPKTVKKGNDEYMIVVSGVKDTGLCGGYWGNTEQLGRRRSRNPPETLQPGTEGRRGSVGSTGSADNKATPKGKKAVDTPQAKSNKKQVTKPEKKAESEVETEDSEAEAATPSRGRGRKRKAGTPQPTDKKSKAAKKEEEVQGEFSDYDSGTNEAQPVRKKRKGEEDGEAGNSGQETGGNMTSKQLTAVQTALAAGVPAGQQRSVSCVADTSTQREVVVECFAPYDDHRWVNIGKERDGMAPDAVQYARALRPPYHLLSFLRIKGHSTKGMSCTDKNTMVFVVLEGEITVILHTTQFNAKKGDSFYIPPKNYYNLINQKAREAELSLIQFQYDGPLPTVQPNGAQ